MQFSYYTRLDKDEGFTDTAKEIYMTVNAPILHPTQTISIDQAINIQHALRHYYTTDRLASLMPDDVITGAIDAIIIEINGEHIKIKSKLK